MPASTLPDHKWPVNTLIEICQISELGYQSLVGYNIPLFTLKEGGSLGNLIFDLSHFSANYTVIMKHCVGGFPKC